MVLWTIKMAAPGQYFNKLGFRYFLSNIEEPNFPSCSQSRLLQSSYYPHRQFWWSSQTYLPRLPTKVCPRGFVSSPSKELSLLPFSTGGDTFSCQSTGCYDVRGNSGNREPTNSTAIWLAPVTMAMGTTGFQQLPCGPQWIQEYVHCGSLTFRSLSPLFCMVDLWVHECTTFNHLALKYLNFILKSEASRRDARDSN